MPIMTRMRDSMPTILFALLVAFLITLVFDWGMDYMGIRNRSNDLVGSVNGRKVNYREFADLVKMYADNQKAQSGAEPDESQMKQARDQAWQSLVTKELVDEQIKQYGIQVSDQEIVDWVRGDNPPDDLRRNFVDSTGQFRRDIYDQFLNDPNQFLQDPNGGDASYGTKWLARYELDLRQRRAQEKLQSLIQASVQVSEGDILRKFHDQNVKYEFLYAMFDPNRLVPDSTVQISEDDIHAYYNDHLDQQKVEATRKIRFVQFREDPSSSDTVDVKNEIEQLSAKARKGEDFIGLIYANDEKPDSGSWFKRGELTPDLQDAAFSTKVGGIAGPFLQQDGYHLLKVLDERKSDAEFVHASHILISVDATPDSVTEKATAQTVARLAKEGKDFAGLAKQYSKDPGSAEHGGDLGWFAKGRMVKSFEAAAFSAKPGQVVGPIRTQFGWHIIKVHAHESREVKVADLLMPIHASSQTKGDVNQRSVDFASNAKGGDFVKEAQSVGFETKEAVVREKGGMIQGLGVNESAVRWAFDNDVGDVSESFSVNNGYAVFMIEEIKEAGVRPFDEVKETLRPAALRQMKMKKVIELAAERRAQLTPTDSLSKLQKINPPVIVQHAGPVPLNGAIPGIGRDFNVIGAVAGMSVGQISNPVEATRGAYLLQLLSRTAFDSTAYKAQHETLRTQMLQERKNKFTNDWLAKLKEMADIVDNRDKFYR